MKHKVSGADVCFPGILCDLPVTWCELLARVYPGGSVRAHPFWAACPVVLAPMATPVDRFRSVKDPCALLEDGYGGQLGHDPIVAGKKQTEFWKQQAVQLLPKTLEVIHAVKDEHLRNVFLRDVPQEPPQGWATDRISHSGAPCRKRLVAKTSTQCKISHSSGQFERHGLSTQQKNWRSGARGTRQGVREKHASKALGSDLVEVSRGCFFGTDTWIAMPKVSS